MTVKKQYKVGDDAWVAGFGRKFSKGKVIKVIDLADCGYSIGSHYIISIPTEIEPLLEIRTWESISQDKDGPVGMFRERADIDTTIRFLQKTGIDIEAEQDILAEPAKKPQQRRRAKQSRR